MNDLRTYGGFSANPVPLSDGLEGLRSKHDHMSLLMRAAPLDARGTPEFQRMVSAHRALTDFLDGRADQAALARRLEEIEQRERV